MALLTAALGARGITLEPRSVTLVPTATSGVPASTKSHSHSQGPTPTVHFHSEVQKKAPVGLIVGVALGVIAAIVGLFVIRYLFVRRARRREAASTTLGAGAKGMTPYAYPQTQQRADPQPPRPPPSERDAVELAQYPPPGAGHTASGSWSTPFSPAPASAAEPGSASSPAARQAYLAAELRAAQTLLERGGKGVNVAKTKARIRELEERQSSAWAMG
ncbi:hypothetical protein B0H11DRAFT_2126109, partial [Mycena galericulata]